MTGTEIQALLKKQRIYYQSGATLSVDFRVAQLKRLYAAVKAHRDEINAALTADLLIDREWAGEEGAAADKAALAAAKQAKGDEEAQGAAAFVTEKVGAGARLFRVEAVDLHCVPCLGIACAKRRKAGKGCAHVIRVGYTVDDRAAAGKRAANEKAVGHAF